MIAPDCSEAGRYQSSSIDGFSQFVRRPISGNATNPNSRFVSENVSAGRFAARDAASLVTKEENAVTLKLQSRPSSLNSLCVIFHALATFASTWSASPKRKYSLHGSNHAHIALLHPAVLASFDYVQSVAIRGDGTPQPYTEDL